MKWWLSFQITVDVGCRDSGHRAARFKCRRPDVWRKDYVRHFQQSRVHSGLEFVDVEACAADVTAFQGVAERSFIDDRAARGVDDARPSLHFRDRRGVDQVMGLAIQRRVNRDDVSRCEQLVERLAPAHTDDFESESPCARSDRCSDPPDADDAEAFALQRDAEHVQRLPDAAAGRPHFVISFDQTAGDGENQRHRQVRRRLGQNTGRVRDDDAELARSGNIDIVVADGAVRDDPQIRVRRQNAAGEGIAQ